MSWLRDDDDMLDHEKWRRALRDGGDGALLVWARLRAWCSRRLTDGRVPADMVDSVAEIGRSKSRARALRALIEHGLCTRHAHGEITICGYLERNPCAAEVRAARGRRAESQKKRRVGENVTGHAETTDTDRSLGVTKSRPNPGPIPIPAPEGEETLALEPAPVPVPGPEPIPEPEPVTEPLPMPVPAAPPAVPEPPRLRLVPSGAGPSYPSFPKGWRWSAETAAAASMGAVSASELQEHVDYWTLHDFSRPTNDLDGELRRSLGAIRTHWETERAKAARASPQQTSRPRRYGSAQPDAGKTGWEALDSPGVVQR